ncbi:ATP-dependent DNA helicase RecG [Oceanivirga salmonicida]|uniref:ATP-dependent DNA helicase RecG n=1 Tax=Oceanivirga salmonicida TaxID=1769291 RepID=UPI0012E203C6|nr:ATP-dependent DNA helicase RecG [Oceanivirga salmonicida]
MTKYDALFQDLENIKLKGLTTVTIKNLKNLNIYNLYDLFYYFPRAYENSAVYKKIINTYDGETAIVKGKIISINRRYLAKNRLMVTAILSDETGCIELLWFNNKYVYSNIVVGTDLIVTAKIKKTARIQMINPSYKKSADISTLNSSVNLEPIYPLTKGINQKKLRDLIKNAIDKYGVLLQENIPLDFLYNNKIMSRTKSITNIHFPENSIALDLAIRRFTYEEIMVLEMGILKNKYLIDKNNKHLYFTNDNKMLVKKYIASLDYELTNSQKKVITTIYNEIKKGKIINRLIQGDVGSGKTVVAMIIMLYMAENNYQTAMMAPTEILATQHYNNVQENFKNLEIRVELLTSSVKGKKREKLLSDIANGEVDIVIGTHSLIETNVIFKSLALTVIDEQHRFGVEQRNALREKSNISNMIFMSATPIPRSLALTIYGDLDISTINEMPKGRQKVITKYIKTDEQKEKMYEFIDKKLSDGQQVYIVAPLIEKSEKLKMVSVLELYDEIKEKFSKYNVGLLHGKLKNKDKETVMNDFKEHKINILVSTTVIEVGVDVPNSNIMLIKSAERFGLSSLHQLRGRVGRGDKKAYCFLESTTTNEVSEKRLEILENETDGFKIAEEDLKLRNSGEIFGLKQSGISDLVLLDIVKNIKEIEQVKEFVKKYLEEHNGKINNEYLIKDIKNKQDNKHKE